MSKSVEEIARARVSAKPKKVTLNIDRVEAILRCGQKMSNVFYNMKQDDRVPADWREWARILQEEWDSFR